MWGCITYDDPGYACRIYDGTMKKEDYVHILDTTLMDTLNYYNYDPKSIYFQQDNDPKHTSKVAKAWFEENNFDSKSIYSWPAQSPDLNPIEHVWHHLKLKLSAYETRAKGVHELWDRIEEQWASFTKDDCRKYSSGQNWCTKIKIIIASPLYACDFCGIYYLKDSLRYTL
ncbi:hypothetical protein G6F29_013465 [Rhizopus arrhizus]|nr:hypothetical protein G6F19_013384 [Rhizopus arrhizus]KAG0972473.1 hypothetical protein G6F29_013465 [Rhizopus arrhizus]KAG1013660.1 hypothetical protein G6F26_013371 [Rhizopus arrhizus]